MSEALTLAVYILCCQENGKVPVFPGNEFFYNTVDDCSFAPSIADMSVWAGSHDHTRNEAFTHTNGDTFMWKFLWPKLLSYFGVVVCPCCFVFVSCYALIPPTRYNFANGSDVFELT